METVNKKILLVEDDKVNQLIATKLLKSLGCQIEFAENGQVAIEQVKNNHYDLVFMDIHMPVLNGIEATEQIREFNKDIYIIALTASILEDEVQAYYQAGMNDVLSKPINKIRLNEKLIAYSH